MTAYIHIHLLRSDWPDNPIVLSDDEAHASVLEQSLKSIQAHPAKREIPTSFERSSRHKAQRRLHTAVPDAFIEARTTTFSCVVCTNDIPRTLLPMSITATCNHPPQTCRSCISSWISSRLESSGYGSLTCPQCDEPLDQTNIREFATPETYEQYDLLMLRAFLSETTEFHWCIGSGCQSGQLHDNSGPIFRCVQCGHRSCINHKVPWHDGLTCAQLDTKLARRNRRRMREEAKSQKLVDEISQQCPGKNCGWRIEKNQGCDHMTCRKCKAEFCWVCRADYKDIIAHGNLTHDRSCRYHSTNVI